MQALVIGRAAPNVIEHAGDGFEGWLLCDVRRFDSVGDGALECKDASEEAIEVESEQFLANEERGFPPEVFSFEKTLYQFEMLLNKPIMTHL